LNYMSLGTHSYFARCPQRPRALLALCPSSWPQLTRQALLRGPAGRYVSQDRGRWPWQAARGCKLGHIMMQGPAALGLPQSRGHALTLCRLGLSGSPHQPQQGQRQRQRRFLRVLLSVFSKSFHVRGTLREAGSLGEALTPPWARACRPLAP